MKYEKFYQDILLFYDWSMFFRSFLSEINDPIFRQHKADMLLKLQEYLASTACRRK